MVKKAIYIDGNSLLHRAFYALPPSMHTEDGTPTNAIYGFFTMLFHIVDEYTPDYLAVAFDVKKITFRHAFYADYKGGRSKTPDELRSQFPLLKKALKDVGIPCIELEEYEADDILGTLAKKGDELGIRTYILTGDRDALQLISENTRVIITKKGVTDTEVYDAERLKEVFGVTPPQIVDMKGLMGDSSDNIPGVAGVGEKTAVKLLGQYPTVEELYEHIEELPKNKLYEKLVKDRDNAFLSKKLATIVREVPISLEIADTAYAGMEEEALKKVLTELRFSSLMKRFGLKEQPKQEIGEVVIRDKAVLAEKVKGASALALTMDQEAVHLAVNGTEELTVPYSMMLFSEDLSLGDIFETLRSVLEDVKIKKYTHGAKELMHMADSYGVGLAGVEFDVEIAAYVLDPTRRNYTLEKLAERYALGGKACAVWNLREKQQAEINAKELELVFYDIEMPLIGVLFAMEKEGFRVDLGRLKELSLQYGERINGLTAEIYELAEEEFNIASTKQLGVILFEKLGLPAKKKTKTGYSTDAEVLEGLMDQHEIIPRIMEYRQLTKQKSTYIEGLLNLAGSDGKMHTTFQQTATATGRISSTEPNLQNIPVRAEISRDIREVFLPSRDENLIVSADYSQIELRVLAHIADDENMKDAFLKDEDIHARTASEVFGVPIGEVKKEMRSSAKAVNFGIVYGISEFGLARNLGIPRYIAADYIHRYLQEFSGVAKYMKDIVEQAKKDGFVRTLFGRIRYIDELKASNFNTRSFGERVAMNTPIQGTAADIIKCAMIRVHRALDEKQMKSRLILQVHDELIVDTVPEEKEAVESILRETMENACSMSVPLKVNAAAGRTWAEAK